MSSAIKETNADIIVLEEVEDCTVLNMVLDNIGDDSYRYYLVKGTDTATGQNVGLITRVDPSINLARTDKRADFPVAGSNCGYSTEGDSGVSKHFYTRFDVQNLDAPLVIIGAHLIAFPVEPSRCAQREAQATVLRDLAKEQAHDKGYHLIMLGDFNDYDSSFLDAANDVPLSKALQIMKTDSSGKTLMLNVGSKISTQSKRWSSWYDKNDNCKHTPDEDTLIDHILISNSLTPHLSTQEIEHDAYTPACDSYYSDHWPYYVRFSL